MPLTAAANMPAPGPAPSPMRRGPPVSRTVPSGAVRPGEIKLSPAEREAARIAGVSDVEYARGKVRLMEEKARGRYMEPS